MLLVSTNRFGEFGEGYLYVEYPRIAEHKYPVIENHFNEDHMQRIFNLQDQLTILKKCRTKLDRNAPITVHSLHSQ